MKKLLGAAVVLACGIAGTVLGQTSHTESTTKHTGPGPDTKMKTEKVVGIVKEYEAGKSIEITGPDKKDYSFELDENAKVSGNIVVGKMARVEYRKDDSGRERVVVISDSTKAKMDHSHGKDGQTAKLGEATVPKMHMESETKHSGPGADTKTKTEVVIGTVKDYEAGKKITVTGPDNNDHSFDLDENATVKTGVAVGQTVQVEYTKTETGEKVMVVAPSKKMPKKVS